MSNRQSRKLSSARPFESGSSSSRTGTSSRNSNATTSSASAGHAAARQQAAKFAQHNGRTFLNDRHHPYPLPLDLPELHRQSLRTMLLIQVHGAPLYCPTVDLKPPKRVLEIGCGPGYWSMMCHRHFKSLGHTDVCFYGIDIARVAFTHSFKPDHDMDWTFVQHDATQAPWPFPDGYFDIVFNKDMTLAIPLPCHPSFTEESLRTLKSGGTLEIWETDHTIRMLRFHDPETNLKPKQAEQQQRAAELGAYRITHNTPFSVPRNTHIAEYNTWLSRALEARQLMGNPCTIVNHYLYQEADMLTDVHSHRLAIPFNEIRWEREGVSGVVTMDGKPYIGKEDTQQTKNMGRKTLTADQAALRRTALLTLIPEIQGQETMLRGVNGKSQDEWDAWLERLIGNLLDSDATSWGECLEIGAWCARKK